MSGRRCRALRRAFREQNGRPPRKTQWTGSRWFGAGGYSYVPSEWRRVKKAELLRARSGR